MKAKRAIRLPSSDRTLFFPDGSIEEEVLTRLLDEAEPLDLPRHKKIMATAKERDLRLNEWGYDGAYKFVTKRVQYRELRRLWRNLPGADIYPFYTPENESNRLHWQAEALRRQAEFPYAMGLFMKYGAKELGVIVLD